MPLEKVGADNLPVEHGNETEFANSKAPKRSSKTKSLAYKVRNSKSKIFLDPWLLRTPKLDPDKQARQLWALEQLERTSPPQDRYCRETLMKENPRKTCQNWQARQISRRSGTKNYLIDSYRIFA